MRAVKRPAVCLLLLLVAWAACATAPKLQLERADKLARDGELPRALLVYDRVVGRKDASVAEKLQGLLDGADVCDRLNDPDGARARLERGIALEAPGLTEKALYYLAEHTRAADRARALNLYYRAAAMAERNGRGFPYKAAMDRIIQMSMSSQ
jgi:hypothetical protein